MNRKREKTIAILLIAIFMISMMTFVVPIAFASPEVPEVRLSTEGPGTATWSTVEKYSGIYSAYISDGGVGQFDTPLEQETQDYGVGRVVVKGVNILLADIDSLSYWFNYEFPAEVDYGDGLEPIDWWNFPYIVLEMDKSGGDTPDVWIVLCSTHPEWTDYYEDPEASMPAEGVWVQWSISGASPPSGYDNFHDSGPGALNIGTPTEGATLAEIQAGYATLFPNAKILKVKVAVGQWGYGTYDPVTAYIDDIKINDVTYDLEPVIDVAEWSSDEAHSGSYSAYLEASGDLGTEARIVITMPEGFTLGQLDSFSWWTYTVVGYPPHVDIILADDIDGEPNIDSLTAELAENDNPENKEWSELKVSYVYGSWRKTFEYKPGWGDPVVDDETVLWVTRHGAGCDDAPYGTLAELKAGTVTPSLDYVVDPQITIDASSVILRLEIEVDNWLGTAEAYVDDVEINGYTYDLEPPNFKSEEVDAGSGTVDATVEADTEVDYDATGSTTITVTSLDETPEEKPSFKTIGKNVDVYVPDPDALDSITIKVYYDDPEDIIGIDESSLAMYYWNNLKSAWLRCSHTGVNTTANYIWALLDDSIPTTPGLDYLLGGPFTPGVPEIILTPDEGFATTITGGGFTPLDTITIKWEGTVMITYPVEVVCDGVGEFGFAMVTALGLFGDYTISATDEHDHTAFATFTVSDMTGPQGPLGPQGDEGPQGLTGATGPQGDEGPQGAKGSKGSTGSRGATGSQGPQGEQGEIGPPGPQGDVGPVGSKGERGLQGVAGETGETGAQGSTGPAGPPGPPGDTGERGPAGSQGKPAPAALVWVAIVLAVISLVAALYPLRKSFGA